MGKIVLESWMSIGLLVVTAGVAYIFGVLRDFGQTKANRNARHEDETLAAAAAMIGGARLMSTATEDLAWARTHLASHYRAQMVSLGGSRPAQPADEEERNKAWRDQASARAVFQPALLKLSILKPDLGVEANILLEKAKRTGDDHTQWQKQADAFVEAEKVFIAAVRRSLKVKGKRF